MNISESKHYNQQVQLFPNPTEDLININVFEPIQSYSLIDMNGRIVKFKFLSELFSSKLKINISDLNSGLYTLSILLENNKTIAYTQNVTHNIKTNRLSILPGCI